MGTCLTSSKKNIVTQKKIVINKNPSKINFNDTNSKINSQNPSNKEVNAIIKFSEPEPKGEKKKEEEQINRKSNHRKTVSLGEAKVYQLEEKLDLKNKRKNSNYLHVKNENDENDENNENNDNIKDKFH